MSKQTGEKTTAADISSETKDAMLKRLARVEGQIRGVQKLIRADDDCEKIAQQMSAARKALDKAFHEMLACMIETDVLNAREEKSAEESMAQIRYLLSKYSWLRNLPGNYKSY